VHQIPRNHASSSLAADLAAAATTPIPEPYATAASQPNPRARAARVFTPYPVRFP